MPNGCYIVKSDKSTIDKLFNGKGDEYEYPYDRMYGSMGMDITVLIGKVSETHFAVYSLNDGCVEAVCEKVKSRIAGAKADILHCKWRSFVDVESEDTVRIQNPETFHYYFSFRDNADIFVDLFVDGSITYGYKKSKETVQRIITQAIRIFESQPARAS